MLRRQLAEGVLLDDVYVSGGDGAAGIYIIAEVRTCHRLKSLRLTQISVATGYYSAGVYIAHQHLHGDGDATNARPDQRESQCLKVADVGQTYCDLSASNNRGAYHRTRSTRPWRDLRIGDGYGRGKGNDYLVIPGDPAAAAFNARRWWQ